MLSGAEAFHYKVNRRFLSVAEGLLVHCIEAIYE